MEDLKSEVRKIFEGRRCIGDLFLFWEVLSPAAAGKDRNLHARNGLYCMHESAVSGLFSPFINNRICFVV